MDIFTAIFTLILIMDPLGNIPLFLSILKHIPPHRQRWVILRESLIAFGILTAFLFFGSHILHALHVSEPSLNISGGIILFIVAIRMIFPKEETEKEDKPMEEPLIVPLAIPLIAGPATMATVVLFASQYPDKIVSSLMALMIASGIFTVIMLTAPSLMHLLKARGLVALERLMGMILTTVAVEMSLSGLVKYFVI